VSGIPFRTRIDDDHFHACLAAATRLRMPRIVRWILLLPVVVLTLVILAETVLSGPGWMLLLPILLWGLPPLLRRRALAVFRALPEHGRFASGSLAEDGLSVTVEGVTSGHAAWSAYRDAWCDRAGITLRWRGASQVQHLPAAAFSPADWPAALALVSRHVRCRGPAAPRGVSGTDMPSDGRA
jgi:hypothetical protein